MLIQFIIENYKSFKNEVTLDFQKTRCSEYPYHIVTQGNEGILRIAAIHGANAAGKSNIYDAFESMRSHVLFSHMYDCTNPMKYTPFAFDTESSNKPTKFEVYFTLNKFDGNEYHYGFCFNSTGIVEEWLNTKPIDKTVKFKTIFYRSTNETDLKQIPKKFKSNLLTSMESNTLFISMGAKLKIPICKTIFNWFSSTICANFEVYDDYVNPVTELEDSTDIVKYLNTFNKNIVDIIFNETFGKNRIVYRINDNVVEIPLSQESAGMKKMFNLYFILKSALTNGSVVFINSLDSHLHTLLLRDIEITFFDEASNPNNAQLIFTTDNVFDMDNLRRDEIWFVEKKDNVSDLYSLVDFKGENDVKIRKDEVYYKNYLCGKYGAIPELERINLI